MQDDNPDNEKRVLFQKDNIDKEGKEKREKSDKKKRYWKLMLLYILQILFVMYITSMTIDPILAAMVGAILGIIITMIVKIFQISKKKKSKVEKIKELKQILRKKLEKAIFRLIAKFFKYMPDEFKEMITYIYDESKIQKLKKYKYLITELIDAKNHIRAGKYDEAKNLLGDIKNDAENNFADIFEEIQILLKSL